MQAKDAVIPELPDSLRQLYPFASNTLTLKDGERLHYIDEGEGDEAVLMVHGNPTWSFYYRNLVKELQSRFRCIVPDHIGCGLSSKPQTYRYELAQHVDNLSQLIETLSLKKIHLVLHDWGGAIGMGAAQAIPDKIGSIVVLNTAAFRSTNIPARIALCRTPALGSLIVRGLNGFAGPATTMAMSQRELTTDEKAGFLFPYDNWENRVAVNAFVKDIPLKANHPSYETLHKIENNLGLILENPMLIEWGGKDFCFDHTFRTQWQMFFPKAKTTIHADAGHYVLEDAPEVIPNIRNFLNGALRR